MKSLQLALGALLLVSSCGKKEAPPVTPTTTDASASPPIATAPVDASSTPPLEAGPRFVGRFDRSDPASALFAFPGSAIEARFRGASLAVRLHEPPGTRNHFTVVLDGKEQRLVPHGGEGRYVLGERLDGSEHAVRLVRNTDPFVGESRFLGFELAPGGAFSPVPPRSRRLLFVGDSITSGYGAEGPGPSCGYAPAQQNAYVAWGSVAGRSLDADVTLVAFSGGGIYRNNDGDLDDTMPARFLRTIPTRKTSVWSFDEPAPDAVVVALSTNDFAMGAPPHDAFVSAYIRFLSDLRARWPKAVLVAALGPMLYGPALDSARLWTKEAVKAREARGDEVHFLELAMQDGSDGYGCQYHPSPARHRRMAGELEKVLRPLLMP
jgi:lysophospholipase L1-like esterase